MSQSMQRIKAPDFESRELARWLLGELAKRPKIENFQDSDPIEGDRLTSGQLIAVSDAELEAFAERLLQKNRYLVKAHEGEELKRSEGQSACDFLAHAIEHRCAEERAQIDRITQSTTKPLFVDSTLDSIQKSIAASNQFEDLIKQYSIGASSMERSFAEARVEPRTFNVPPMNFPKNPVFETNQILENLTNQIQGMRPLVAQGAELIRSMNDTALRMQADYLANAERSDRQTSKAMLVAVASFVVSAIGLAASSYFSYQSYADAMASGEKGTTQVQAFEKGIRDLTKAQREDREVFMQTLVDSKRGTPTKK